MGRGHKTKIIWSLERGKLDGTVGGERPSGMAQGAATLILVLREQFTGQQSGMETSHETIPLLASILCSPGKNEPISPGWGSPGTSLVQIYKWEFWSIPDSDTFVFQNIHC